MDKIQIGGLWDKLNEVQQQELLLAYNESFDQANLVNHEEMKKQHEQWLSPKHK